MSNTRTSTLERNGHAKGTKTISPWTRAMIGNSEWNDKVNKSNMILSDFISKFNVGKMLYVSF